MKKFTLYIPLIGGVISIMLALFTLIYMFGFKEPSVNTILSGSLIWTALVFLSIYLIGQFIDDIENIAYWKGKNDCKAELRNGPLKDMYEQYLKKLSNQ